MKLNYKRTFFIGFAFMSICAFWQTYDNIIPLILQNTFHLNEVSIGTIMAIDNVLAVILLPLLGSLSDKVSTPLGKRTPFILVGTILAVIFMMIMIYADFSANIWLFVIALGITLLSMALYRSPAVALMPDLTPKPLRSKANAVINLMGAIGGMYSLLLTAVLVKKTADKANYLPLFIGIALIMIVSIIFLVSTVNENKVAKQIAEEYPEEIEKNTTNKKAKTKMPKDVRISLIFILLSIFLWFTAYNAVTTAFSRYAENVWGLQGGSFANCLMVAMVAAILSYIPIGFISSRLGRKKTILLGLALMFISYFSVIFVTTYTPIINVSFALVGIGWASVSVNSLPMVVDMASGNDVGKFTGLYYTFSMTAQILTPIISGFLLQNVSYKTLFPYATFFTTLSFITMLFVRHGDTKPLSKKSLIENFDVDD